MKISRRSFERIHATLYLAIIMMAKVLISGILLLSQAFDSIIITMSIIVILMNSSVMAIICCYDVISKLEDIDEYQTLEEDEE